MSDNDELALIHEPFQHFDKTINIRFVERCIHFIEQTEWTWAHHIDSKEKRHCRHRALATAEQRNVLQLFTGRFGDNFDSAVQRIVFIKQLQVSAAATK